MDLVRQFEQLRQLRDEGTLSEEEFSQAKQQLLAGDTLQAAPGGGRSSDNASDHEPDHRREQAAPAEAGGPERSSHGGAWVAAIIGVALVIGIGIMVLEPTLLSGAPAGSDNTATSEPWLDGGRVEQRLSRAFVSMGATFLSPSCPTRVDAVPGREFNCVLSDRAEPSFQYGRVELEVQNSDGELYWRTIQRDRGEPSAALAELQAQWGSGPPFWVTEGFIEVALSGVRGE